MTDRAEPDRPRRATRHSKTLRIALAAGLASTFALRGSNAAAEDAPGASAPTTPVSAPSSPPAPATTGVAPTGPGIAPVADDPNDDPPKEPSHLGPDATKRRDDLTPKPAEPPHPSGKIRFTADPIGDGGTVVVAATFGFLSSVILGTEEIRPQQISPNFDKGKMLGIDRWAIERKPNPDGKTLSNIGLFGMAGYVVLDTVLDGFREGKSAALVDGIMYVEAFLVTQGVTNLAKIAFRRPRPIAYIERDTYIANGGNPAAYDNSSTDSALSFFSGHSSQTAALAAASTYIAFSRSPGTVRPWLTLAGGTAVTAFVAYERVNAGSHFPTDVLAGAAAGAGIGALVVHLHREDSVKQRPVWIGAAPLDGGGVVNASGFF